MTKNAVNVLLYFLKKDLKSRYAGSGLGMVWTILMPLLQILLFWFVFAGVLRARPYANGQTPYISFLLSSFFFWLAFSEGLARASTSIVDNSEMVKKIPFPNILLPVTVTISSYIHNMCGFIVFIIVYALTSPVSPVVVLVIPVLFLQLLFSLGLGMFFSALLPYVRDIGQLIAYILQGLFFLSPIMYSMETVPERFRPLFYFNPLTYFASSYQKIILLTEVPSLPYIAIILFLPLGTLAAGLFTFKKLRGGFADVL